EAPMDVDRTGGPAGRRVHAEPGPCVPGAGHARCKGGVMTKPVDDWTAAISTGKDKEIYNLRGENQELKNRLANLQADSNRMREELADAYKKLAQINQLSR